MYNNNQLNEFRMIVGEEPSTDELKTYLTWGKGNLESALNYFFHRQQKYGTKNRAPTKNYDSDDEIDQDQQENQQNNDQLNNFNPTIQEEENSNAFDELKNAQKKQAQIRKIVEEAKEELKKPAQSVATSKMQNGKYVISKKQLEQKGITSINVNNIQNISKNNSEQNDFLQEYQEEFQNSIKKQNQQNENLEIEENYIDNQENMQIQNQNTENQEIQSENLVNQDMQNEQNFNKEDVEQNSNQKNQNEIPQNTSSNQMQNNLQLNIIKEEITSQTSQRYDNSDVFNSQTLKHELNNIEQQFAFQKKTKKQNKFKVNQKVPQKKDMSSLNHGLDQEQENEQMNQIAQQINQMQQSNSNENLNNFQDQQQQQNYVQQQQEQIQFYNNFQQNNDQQQQLNNEQQQQQNNDQQQQLNNEQQQQKIQNLNNNINSNQENQMQLESDNKENINQNLQNNIQIQKPKSIQDIEKQMEEEKSQILEEGDDNFPKYLGEGIIVFKSLKQWKNQMAPGEQLELKCEKTATIQQGKTNKGGRAKKNVAASESKRIRVLYKDRELGRLENNYENALYKLIMKNYIYVEATLVWAPPLVDVFTKINLRLKVYIMKTAISRPITRIIDAQEIYNEDNKILKVFEETKQEFNDLFHGILQLKVKVSTLIQMNETNKSFLNNKPQIDQKNSSSILKNSNSNKEEVIKNNKAIFDPFKARGGNQVTLDMFQKTSSTLNLQNTNQNNVQKKQENQDTEKKNTQDFSKLFEMEGIIKDDLKLSEPSPRVYKSKLHDYQKQALTWMLMREGKLNEIRKILDSEYRVLHPLWESFIIQEENSDVKQYLYFNPYSGQVSIKIPRASTQCFGGLLADEMGLGKTVMMLSLIVTNKKYGCDLQTATDEELIERDKQILEQEQKIIQQQKEKENQKNIMQVENENQEENDNEEDEDDDEDQENSFNKEDDDEDNSDKSKQKLDDSSQSQEQVKLQEQQKKQQNSDGNMEIQNSPQQQNKKLKRLKKSKKPKNSDQSDSDEIDDDQQSSLFQMQDDEEYVPPVQQQPQRRQTRQQTAGQGLFEKQNKQINSQQKLKSQNNINQQQQQQKSAGAVLKQAIISNEKPKKTNSVNNNSPVANMMMNQVSKSQKQMSLNTKMFKIQAKTLIIVPVTLLAQWEDEIKVHIPKNTVSFYIYYEKNKKANVDLSLFDIVITTYGTVSHQWNDAGNKNKHLYKYDWYRIVLDEAHTIKGRTIQVSKAVFALEGRNRWCLSGTPLQNSIDELFALIHFIKLEPWSDYIWWNQYINKPSEKGDPIFYEIVQTIMKPVTMRRTKQSKGKNGKQIIDLPPKNTEIYRINMAEEERAIYDHIQTKSKEEFLGLVQQGVALAKYAKIFEIMTRLRQLCDHPFLIQTRSGFTDLTQIEDKIKKFLNKRHQFQQQRLQQDDNSEDHSHFELVMDEQSQHEQRIDIKKSYPKPSETLIHDTIFNIKNERIENCQICLDTMEDAVITACCHLICRLCMVRSQEVSSTCPLCKRFLVKDDWMTVPRESRFNIDIDKQYQRSSKIEAVMEKLAPIIEKKEKVIIFTQYLGMMDLLQKDFKENGYKNLRLDGSVPQKKRQKLLKDFKEIQEISILIISLKAGGVGLNLTHANHCFLVDPWWNPAVEDQAIERVHRIGQKKEVYVTRFIIEDSIESRMLEIHKTKKEMFDMTMKTDNTGNNQQSTKEKNLKNMQYLIANY